jgi:hypothetical protein
MKQRLRETQQLLSNAEAASEAAEKRLAESKQVLSIPLRDIQLSDIQLGSGSFGGAVAVLLEIVNLMFQSLYSYISCPFV